MNSLVFPDINVWIALTLRSHQHNQAAWRWYQSLAPGTRLGFCRVTQLSFLRLLTLKAVAGEATMTQRQAWIAYDRWIHEGGAKLLDEPFGLELELRAITQLNRPATLEWADSYLAAFAASDSISLVTFDKALSLRCSMAILLEKA